MANRNRKLPWEHKKTSTERPVPSGPIPANKKSRRMFSSGSGGICVINEKKYPSGSVITSDMPTAGN